MEEEKPEKVTPEFENKEESAVISDSNSSEVVSGRSTPDNIDFKQDEPKEAEVDPEKVKQDVAARGIIRPVKSFNKSATLRGSFVSDVPVTSESDSSLANPKVEPDDNNNISDGPLSSSSTASSTDIPINNDDGESKGPEFVKVGERTKSFITRQVNETVELSSVCTQTENSWLKDIDLFEELLKQKPEWINKIRLQRKESESSIKKEDISKPKGHVRRKKKSLSRTSSSPGSPLIVDSKADDEEVQVRLESEEKLSREPSGSKSRLSFGSPLPQTPKEDILYRPPTVEMFSSSDSEYEEDYAPDESILIPSIGPPAILQYFKESQHPPIVNSEMDEEAQGKEFLKKSLFTGPCMFCKNEVLPFPTEEELENPETKPEDLFCCLEYERFIKFEISQRGDTSHVRDELIDIKPHPPYGTKAARKAAKERAAERARQREMERQKVAGANATNFYALTRQMKTITYSLASTKCMDEGWTVKPLTPIPDESSSILDPFVIEVNPIQQQKRAFLERFYENGQRFLIILPDGSGCCYYPSGNIAVIITTTEKGKFTYIAYEDNNDYDATQSGMLAVFDPSGHGTCYFRNGTVRLVLDPYGGVLLDVRGARRKKWSWHNTKAHVHAPPFQPITFSITKQLSVRCLTQDKIILTYNHGKYTAKFNVGSKLKAVRGLRTPPLDRDDYEVHLAEVKQFINIVLDRTQNALRLPKYSRLDKIPLPHRLQKAKETQRGKLSALRTPSQQGADSTTVTVN
ncbi:glutamate-rich protein 6 [Exaiptasia diaphana]|uniref:FAM194 C-terminal domain-containing protein n=1 Tax=Exaiptasia diaphana TaxID=2652724 RepID=A0A913XCY2_EXADI|nr:glutamate-rich protein 6 [Exaiptasia diaphana]KXJ29743.1 Glutamate-rich protein 6 [Exaiptasia diaphana]